MNCVDASVAAKWLFEEEWSLNAGALAAAAYADGELLVGPPHLRAEISNVVLQRTRREGLGLQAAGEAFRTFLAVSLLLDEPDGLYETALEFAYRYEIPANYDAIYVALAWTLGADLWTDDRRLLGRLGGRLPFVRWIGDYPVPVS